MKQYSNKQIWIALTVCLGHMLCGMLAGWSAPIITILQDLKETPLPDVITEKEASWIGSSIYIGVVTGPFLTGSVLNIIGRKPCLLLGGLIMSLSHAILATSVNLSMMIVGRIISGVACGILCASNLVYISEIASTNIRGALLSLIGVAVALGTLMSYAVCPYVSFSSSSYIALAMSLIFIAGVILIPETPVFYLLKGNENKASEVLTTLGRTEDIDDFLTKKLDTMMSTKNDWLEILTVKNNRKTLFITIILMILQNCSGTWVLIMFSTSVFDLVDSNIDANVSTILIGITMLIASGITPVVVDKYGRKILLLISTAVCGMSMALLGLYFFLDKIHHWIIPHLHLLPILSLVVYYLFYNFGFGTIPCTLMSEMFQSNVRGPGCTVTLTIGFLFGWIASSTFGYMVTGFGIHVTFWLYATISFITCIFTFLFVPETKGKSFAEIQCMLSK